MAPSAYHEPMLRGKEGGLSLAAEWAIYVAAAVIYIAVGFVRKEVFAWWSYGAIWFVACAWFIPPAAARLLRRGTGPQERDRGREPPAS